MIEASERANFQLLLAKLYYDTHQHDRSLSVSESFIKRYPSHQEVYKAHFLLALLYLQKQQETEFIFHAELVLKLNKNCSEASRLHYNLFSTYLNRSKQEAVEKHKRLALNKGAQHLYKAYFLEPTLLSSDHTYWLASQLYSEIKMSKDLNLCQDYKKLIEHVLPLSELSVRNKPLNNKEEKILFYYTQVLGFLDFSEKRKTVLQLMEKMYELYPLHEGGSIADVFFELSLYFRDIKDFDQSILYLKKIFLLSERKAPIIYQKSQLLYSRMKLDQYQRMDTFHIENEELHLVLGILKDLQIKKYLLTEPIHLESALEYAHARVLLEPKDQRLGMFLGILEKIKKQFTSEDDIQGKDYREMRKTNVDKDNLFQAYMELIDGKISLVKAALSQDENQKRQLLKKADSIFQHLKISSSIFSNYFNQEVQKGLKHHVVSE